MGDLATAFALGITYALPVVVFGTLHRLGKRLDLSIDAQVAAGAVAFALALKSYHSLPVALAAGIVGALAVALASLSASELIRVRPLISSLLVSILAFRVMQLKVGESVALGTLSERLHPALAGWLPHLTGGIAVGSREMVGVAVALATLLVGVTVLELWSRSHLGLMYRALGDNESLAVRWRPWRVRLVAVALGGALFGLYGALQADREGGFYSGFGLSTLVAAFIVSEATEALTAWARSGSAEPRTPAHRVRRAMASFPVTGQLVIGAVVLQALAYLLLRFTDPGVPEIVEVLALLGLLGALGWRSLRKLGKAVGPDVRRGLVIQGLSKTYREYAHAVPVLTDAGLALDVDHGVVVVWGANAAGKSTLLHTLAGACPPDRGRASFRGGALRGRARLLHQDSYESIAPSLTVGENLALAVARKDPAHLPGSRVLRAEALHLLKSTPGAAALVGAFDRAAVHLSGGQAQLLAIICAVADGSDVILADEPTKQLDAVHKRHVESMLKRIAVDRLVVVTSHAPRLDLAPAAVHVLVKDHALHAGVATDGPEGN